MKFTVENEAFAKALGLAKGSVAPSNTIPILSHVALTAADNQITIRATAIDRETQAVVAANVDAAGGYALPAEVLLGLVKRFQKGGQCSLSVVDGRAHLTAGTSKYELRTLPLEDFPDAKEPAPDATSFSIEASALSEIIGSTIYAASPNDHRHYLRGVFLHVDRHKLIAVATDGHRLGRRHTEMPKGATGMAAVIVPLESAREILRLLETAEGEIGLSVSSRLIVLKMGGLRFASALVEGSFPDYQKFIPKLNGVAATFRPYALAEAVSRASVVCANEKNAAIVGIATMHARIDLTAGTVGNEQAAEVVEAETNGHDISFRVNAKYLADMLGVWPESVSVGVQQEDSEKPILFYSAERPEQSHVVMPSIKG